MKTRRRNSALGMASMAVFIMVMVWAGAAWASRGVQEVCNPRVHAGTVFNNTDSRRNLRTDDLVGSSTLFTPRRYLGAKEMRCFKSHIGPWFVLTGPNNVDEYLFGFDGAIAAPLSQPINTTIPTPTRITAVPTLTELIVFVKVFVHFGDKKSVDVGLFPWKASEPVSCQLLRVDNFPQPTPTRLP